MRILWLSHLLPYPPKGGAQQRSYNLLRQLARHHEVHLLAFNQRALLPRPEQVREAVDHFASFCRSVEVFAIPSESGPTGRYPLYLKSMFTRNPFTINWLLDSTLADRIESMIALHDLEAVHFDTISLAPFLDSARPCATVLTHPNIESAMMLRRARNDSNPLRRFYYYLEGIKLRQYERNMCPKFDLNIACSELDSSRLREHVPGLDIAVVPNPVDTEYFRPLLLSPEPKSLIFVGGMNWYPNRAAMIFFATQVWPLLVRELPGVRMTVVGWDPPPILTDLAGSAPDFRVTGYVDDVRPYLDRATIFICPIRDGGGTKVKIIDAMAMGKPIVADPIACEGLGVRDGETVLHASTPEEYVERIRILLENQGLAARIGNAARELALREHSIVRVGRGFSDLFQGLRTRTATAGVAHNS